MSQVGKPTKIIEVVPLKEPVPEKSPAPIPEKEPVHAD